MAYTTINKSTEHFNSKIYTGNGGTQSITGVGFQPDLVWGKSRSGILYHILSDVVRGATKRIFSNDVSAEETSANTITSFDSDGFSVGSNADINGNSQTQVAWNWKANGSGSANTAGSISSTVSANTTSGFSIVSYTGNGSAGATIGHGLGAVPKMIIVKRLNSVDNWRVYLSTLGATKALDLNGTGAANTVSSRWNDTEPTSSVFSIGTNSGVNASGSTYIAYVFADVQGYSKIGSYIGNGNSDGTFVYTGFKPAWLMIRRTDDAANWTIVDVKRDTYNSAIKRLNADQENSENTSLDPFVDILSNGFKLRATSTAYNGNGGSISYMAFAEAPLVGTNNVPCTAR